MRCDPYVAYPLSSSLSHFVLSFHFISHAAQELNKVAEMTGTNAAIRSMKSKIGKLDKETLKQQEIMYNQVKKSVGSVFLRYRLFDSSF